MAALAALGIVARRCCLVNCHAIGVLVRDLVEFLAIEGNPLFSDADFPQKRAYFLVEYAAAHREICGHLADSDESRRNVGHLSDPLYSTTQTQGLVSQALAPLICSLNARNMARGSESPAGVRRRSAAADGLRPTPSASASTRLIAWSRSMRTRTISSTRRQAHRGMRMGGAVAPRLPR